MHKRTETWLIAAFLTLLSAAYAYWLFTTTAYAAASAVFSAGVCLLFGLVGAEGIRAVLNSWRGEPEVDIAAGLGRRSLRPSHRHPVLRLFLAVLLARLLVFALAYAFHVLQNGYQGGLLDTLTLWLKGDAPHYLGIADNWYVTQGDPRFHIVFFPLYPIAVRLFNLVVQNTFAAGLVASLLFTVAACILLYELALLDMDRAAAKRAVKFQLLLPAAFLLAAPMSDALFLLLSVLTMLLTRKKHYTAACLAGGLAAFTRVLGVVLLVPIVVELIGDALRKYKEDGRVFRFLLPRSAALLLVPMGLAIYLYINYNVTGDAFTFLTYQREHWSQQMGWFFNTAAYQTDYLLKKLADDLPAALGLWLPNLVFLIGAPLLMLLVQRKTAAAAQIMEHPAVTSVAKQPVAADASKQGAISLSADAPVQDSLSQDLLPSEDNGPAAAVPVPARPAAIRQPYRLRASYTAYFLAYYFAGMGATWLLSAPRYLTCCFPLAIALASLLHRRFVLPVYLLLFLAQAAYLWAYVAGWPVY